MIDVGDAYGRSDNRLSLPVQQSHIVVCNEGMRPNSNVISRVVFELLGSSPLDHEQSFRHSLEIHSGPVVDQVVSTPAVANACVLLPCSAGQIDDHFSGG